MQLMMRLLKLQNTQDVMTLLWHFRMDMKPFYKRWFQFIRREERQRISIARAMLKPSKLVILDEATSSVDPENEQELVAALNDLLKDKTVIK